MKFSMNKPTAIRFDPISMFIQGAEGIMILGAALAVSIAFTSNYFEVKANTKKSTQTSKRNHARA